jgi:hypothetical protein
MDVLRNKLQRIIVGTPNATHKSRMHVNKTVQTRTKEWKENWKRKPGKERD